MIHHVRKGQSGGVEFTVEDGRGAGALLAAARSARVLNPMTKDQAEKAGLVTPRGYFRADNGKANLAPPPDRTDWFRLASVPLGNGPDGGDHVAAVEPWCWPDMLEGVTVAAHDRARHYTPDACPLPLAEIDAAGACSARLHLLLLMLDPVRYALMAGLRRLGHEALRLGAPDAVDALRGRLLAEPSGEAQRWRGLLDGGGSAV